MTSTSHRPTTGLRVFLTGGTGLIGSGVLAALLAEGHRVLALARSERSAAALRAAGAQVVPGTLDDLGVLAAAARSADGVVHAASPGDDTSAEVDAAVVDTLLDVLRGSGKPYVHTSGVWTYGSGRLDEASPFDPLALTAWRVPLDARVRAAAGAGVRSVVLAPGIVYAGLRGLPGLLAAGPRDDSGALRLPGSGDQRWATVHAADLGRLYVRALTGAAAGSYYVAAGGDNPTVREIAVAADLAAGGDGRVVGSTPAETARLFGPLARPFLLDQRADGRKARQELGWVPTEPGLVAELRRTAETSRGRAVPAH